PAMSAPSTTDEESRRYATMPAERARYHEVEVTAVSLRRAYGSCRRPLRHGGIPCRAHSDRAVPGDEPAGQAAPVEPGRSAVAEEKGRLGEDVRLEAGPGRDRHVAPG